MEHYLVKDLMVPISEYAVVVVGTPLIEAIRVLEKAQEVYTVSKYQHRSILVLDENGHIVGKISQLRALKALEPEFKFNDEIAEMRKFKFSETYIARLQDKYRSHRKFITDSVLREAANKKVEEFMQAPSPGEYVADDCSLDAAILQLTAGQHLSLLVTRDKQIVGVLRIADVFAAAFHKMMTLKS
ncbi:MAG: CBS domain-containing protein [Desulfocapsaceae bacterium]|nr:CBS domain-containing protein [Desulfocapsaceae bacterium]